MADDPTGAPLSPTPDRRRELGGIVAAIQATLEDAHVGRERALAASRRAIRASGSSIRAVHRLELDRAVELLSEAATAIGEAQEAVADHPAVAHAGFVADAEKEVAEASLVIALVRGDPLPDAAMLGVAAPSWLRGLTEAASELRRHLLDRLRAGELERGEQLLATMDDCYDALVAVDFPDAITGGLRRNVDALRSVLERTRSDVTTTVLQTRLQQALEGASGGAQDAT